MTLSQILDSAVRIQQRTLVPTLRPTLLAYDTEEQDPQGEAETGEEDDSEEANRKGLNALTRPSLPQKVGALRFLWRSNSGSFAQQVDLDKSI